jgi:hypothetical protein
MYVCMYVSGCCHYGQNKVYMYVYIYVCEYVCGFVNVCLIAQLCCMYAFLEDLNPNGPDAMDIIERFRY